MDKFTTKGAVKSRAPITLWARRNGDSYQVTAIGWRRLRPDSFADARSSQRFLLQLASIGRTNYVCTTGSGR